MIAYSGFSVRTSTWWKAFTLICNNVRLTASLIPRPFCRIKERKGIESIVYTSARFSHFQETVVSSPTITKLWEWFQNGCLFTEFFLLALMILSTSLDGFLLPWRKATFSCQDNVQEWKEYKWPGGRSQFAGQPAWFRRISTLVYVVFYSRPRMAGCDIIFMV